MASTNGRTWRSPRCSLGSRVNLGAERLPLAINYNHMDNSKPVVAVGDAEILEHVRPRRKVSANADGP